MRVTCLLLLGGENLIKCTNLTLTERTNFFIYFLILYMYFGNAFLGAIIHWKLKWYWPHTVPNYYNSVWFGLCHAPFSHLDTSSFFTFFRPWSYLSILHGYLILMELEKCFQGQVRPTYVLFYKFHQSNPKIIEWFHFLWRACASKEKKICNYGVPNGHFMVETVGKPLADIVEETSIFLRPNKMMKKNHIRIHPQPTRLGFGMVRSLDSLTKLKMEKAI